jgi:hypothetical protein
MKINKSDALWPKMEKMSRKGRPWGGLEIIDLDNFLILQLNLNRWGNSPGKRVCPASQESPLRIS